MWYTEVHAPALHRYQPLLCTHILIDVNLCVFNTFLCITYPHKNTPRISRNFKNIMYTTALKALDTIDNYSKQP